MALKQLDLHVDLHVEVRRRSTGWSTGERKADLSLKICVQSSKSIAGLARLTRRPESTEKVREALNGDSDKKVTRDAGR